MATYRSTHHLGSWRNPRISGGVLEPVIRHYAADPLHCSRQRAVTIATTGDVELRGFIVFTAADWFALELEADGSELRLRYDEVSAVYHEHPSFDQPGAP